MVTRLTVVADREPFNIESIIHHCNRFPNDLTLGAVLVPFDDLDYDLGRLTRFLGENSCAYDLPPLNLPSPFAIRELEHPFSRVENYACEYSQNGQRRQMQILHVPYTKKMSEAQRFVYSEAFLQVLRMTEPDLVFFANFKAILDGIVPSNFPFMLLNAHPSFLPENRGWRTEKMALDGINPDASGYTFHVLTERLDEGPTLFQQKVPLYKSDGEKHNEESLRLATIIAQAEWAPRVLSLYMSDRKVLAVQGREAFKAEGRESHYNGSERHNQYSRMLFEHEGSFRIMEQILGAPELATHSDEDMVRIYSFRIKGSNHKTFLRANDLLERVRSVYDVPVEFTSNYDFGSQKLQCSVRVTRDISELLRRERIKVESVYSFPVSVTAPRMSFDKQPTA